MSLYKDEDFIVLPDLIRKAEMEQHKAQAYATCSRMDVFPARIRTELQGRAKQCADTARLALFMLLAGENRGNEGG